VPTGAISFRAVSRKLSASPRLYPGARFALMVAALWYLYEDDKEHY